MLVYLHCFSQLLGIVHPRRVEQSHAGILKVPFQLGFQLIDQVLEKWSVIRATE